MVDNSVGTEDKLAGDNHSNQLHFGDAVAASKRTLAVEVIPLCDSHPYFLDGNAPLEEAERGNILAQGSGGKKGT